MYNVGKDKVFDSWILLATPPARIGYLRNSLNNFKIEEYAAGVDVNYSATCNGR